MSDEVNDPSDDEHGDVAGQEDGAHRNDVLELNELRAFGEQRRAARRAALAELNGDRDAWLTAIVDAYLESRDYNGLAVYDGFDEAQTEALAGLIEDELVEIRTSEMSMNPHVRRLPTGASPDEMAALVRRGDCERYVFYPTPKALDGDARIDKLKDRPYEQRMAA